MMIGSHRFDNNRCGALGRSNAWPKPANRASKAIACAALCRLHSVADKSYLARKAAIGNRFQIGECREIADLRRQPRFSGAGTVAERGDGHFLREGRCDGGGFFAAHPGFHLEFFAAHIVEAQRFQFCQRPNARARLRVGSGLARANFGRQSLNNIPCQIIAFERILNGVSNCGSCGGCRERESRGEAFCHICHLRDISWRFHKCNPALRGRYAPASGFAR